MLDVYLFNRNIFRFLTLQFIHKYMLTLDAYCTYMRFSCTYIYFLSYAFHNRNHNYLYLPKFVILLFCYLRSTRTDNKNSSAFTSTFGSRPSSSQGGRDSIVGRDQEKSYIYSNSKSSIQKRTELDVRISNCLFSQIHRFIHRNFSFHFHFKNFAPYDIF